MDGDAYRNLKLGQGLLVELQSGRPGDLENVQLPGALLGPFLYHLP